MKPTFKTALWSVFFSTLVGLLMGCSKFELPAEKTLKICQAPTGILSVVDPINPLSYTFSFVGSVADIDETSITWTITGDSKSPDPSLPGQFKTTYKNRFSGNGTYIIAATFTTKCGTRTVLSTTVTITLATEIANMMVQIPAGTFQMGDVFGEGFSTELPVHSVTLSAFKMSKYEISQAQWVAVMGVNPSNFNTCPTCPVEQISWDDVQVFMTKLKILTGKNYRLPTEAEWEYAAREGGKKVRFGNGKDILDATEANFYAVIYYNLSYSNVGEFRNKTIPVGSFAPNALGLYDMTGNVNEWCSDWYGAYSSSSQTNPTGPATGSNRVLRGGCWRDGPLNSRVAFRFNNTPASRNAYFGFRLVFTQ